MLLFQIGFCSQAWYQVTSNAWGSSSASSSSKQQLRLLLQTQQQHQHLHPQQ
jgi:hypothetical protein